MFASVEMSPTTKASYLPHLDGLRAVALLGVLLFHFEVSNFRGGFIGVDVFLTLSGYLITRNILHDAAANSFSLRTFYVRRFFRLYPASTVVVLFTLLAAYALLAPNLAREVCQSALASQFFSSNFFFYLNANYFETKSLLRPLLHTWSLSLEEHFYLLWAPFLRLLLLIPNARNQFLLIILLALSSFSFACYIYRYNYNFMFYLIPPRAFQFTIGALLAFSQRLRFPPPDFATRNDQVHEIDTNQARAETPCETTDGQHLLHDSFGTRISANNRYSPKLFTLVTNFLSILSLTVLLSFYVFLPKSPGPHLTLPVAIATAVIIHAKHTFLSLFLSSSPMRFIGSLTYSAYLLHWPLWVYTRYLLTILDINGLWRPHPLPLTTLTFLSAWALRNCVEQPLRKGNRRAQVLVSFLFFITVGIAAVGVHSRGYAFRQVGSQDSVARMKKYLAQQKLAVFPLDACNQYNNFLNVGQIDTKVSCLAGPASTAALDNVLVVGNSFAAMWLPALDVIGTRRNIRIPMWFVYRCELRSRSRIEHVQDLGKYACKMATTAIWKRIEEMPKNSTVIFSAFWGFRTNQQACEELQAVEDDLEKIGVNGVLLPEPPGVHPRYERFYNCLDSMKLPVGRVLKWWGLKQKWDPISSCGIDVQKGIEPHPVKSKFEQRYHDCTNLKLLKVLPLSEKICEAVDESSSFKWIESPTRCRFPNSTVVPFIVNDLGYERALFHISTYGAYQLVEVLDDLLAPYLPEVG